MTTHGRSGLARAWMGSIAESLVRRSHVPILLIRSASADTPAGPAPYGVPRHIGIALDGSSLAEQILRAALALGDLPEFAGRDQTLA